MAKGLTPPQTSSSSLLPCISDLGRAKSAAQTKSPGLMILRVLLHFQLRHSGPVDECASLCGLRGIISIDKHVGDCCLVHEVVQLARLDPCQRKLASFAAGTSVLFVLSLFGSALRAMSTILSGPCP